MKKTRKPIIKVPKEHMAEFLAKETELIQSRVRLLSGLAIGIYLFVSLSSLVLAPDEFRPAEIPLGVFLVLGGFLILYLNNRAKSVSFAKLNAYLFTALLLIILSKVTIIYYEYVGVSASIFLFTLFLIVFTLPWNSFDVIPITLMHILAYTFLFVYSRQYLPEGVSLAFDSRVFADGLVFLGMGFVLCLVIRKKETQRDIENFVLLKEVETKSNQMKKELELATRIHKTLIPKSISTDLVDVAVMYLPMYYIGGDYAKFHFIDKDKLIFIICDVTGHGVSAALLVNRIHTEFERLVQKHGEPGMLLKDLNDFIRKDFAGINMYLSAFCCLLDFTKKKLIYANYGHPDQYIYRVTKSDVEGLSSHAGLLGLFEKADEPYQHEITFANGDQILLFTDGVIETSGKDNIDYGQKSLENFIRKNYSLGVGPFNQKLMDELGAFVEEKGFRDDIFMLNIKVK
ncbi:PP2C family protein-serine/threonine phosphatase [Candidatus Omnitrophota bacterium]